MRINKEFLLKIWRDPVGSKVISVGVLGIIGSIYAFIDSKLNESSYADSIIDILNIQIKLWQILVTVIVIIILISIRSKHLANQKRQLQYKFLTEHETVLKCFTWRWTWEKVENSSSYKITDLHPLCPNCKGVLAIPTVLSNYECSKCDYKIETLFVPLTSVVKKQILDDLRKKHPDEALFMTD